MSEQDDDLRKEIDRESDFGDAIADVTRNVYETTKEKLSQAKDALTPKKQVHVHQEGPFGEGGMKEGRLVSLARTNLWPFATHIRAFIDRKSSLCSSKSRYSDVRL